MEISQWCLQNYPQLASAWVHLKALRVYVESLLRYGLHTKVYTFVYFVCSFY